MTRPLLLLLGDSLTQFGSNWRLDGWICLLLDRFNRSADIAQRGMGSYTTQSFMNLVVATLARDLATTLRPQLITLWLGANDAALLDGPNPEDHVPLATYKKNLGVMLALFKAKAPQAKVLLITPGAVDDDARRVGWGGDLDRSNAAAGEYARACVEVAHEAGVAVLDLHTIFNALPEPEWKTMLSDGLHFNKQGNHFMEQLLADTIETTFPDLQAQLEQVEFPLSELATAAPGAESSFEWLHDTQKPEFVTLHVRIATSVSEFESVGILFFVCAVFLGVFAVRVHRKRRGKNEERANLVE